MHCKKNTENNKENCLEKKITEEKKTNAELCPPQSCGMVPWRPGSPQTPSLTHVPSQAAPAIPDPRGTMAGKGAARVALRGDHAARRRSWGDEDY